MRKVIIKFDEKKGSHVNRKINSDGSKSAIQFFDGTNNLNGPVELIEVKRIDENTK